MNSVHCTFAGIACYHQLCVRLQQRPRRQSVDRQDAAYVSPREVRRLLVWGPPGPRRLNKVPSHRPIIVGDVVGSWVPWGPAQGEGRVPGPGGFLPHKQN